MSRVRVSFFRNDQPAEDGSLFPYAIKFVNLAMEDRAETHPLELKHGDGGYLWIEPSEFVEHMTDAEHTFQIRDRNHEPLFNIKIFGDEEVEL